MIGPDLEALTYQHMPEVLFERLLRAVFTAHRVAFEECRSGFAETESANLLPYYRRAKLEGFMRDAATLTGIGASVVRSDGSPWNHTELRSGPVVLTASTVQSPCGPVDTSEFRLTLARANELYLWPEPGDIPPDDAPLYALLLHSRSRWEQRSDQQKFGYMPGSAYIAYPTPNLGEYGHEIDLFAKFPGVVESFMPQEWNSEAKLRYLVNTRKTATA